MTDALKLSYGVAKRSFTVAVVIATILWSVAATFAVAPRAAHAAVSGDLVKGSLSAVYYVGSDGKRYVFTNDKAYFTWYADFSAVKKISDTDLAALTIGGNVTYKPGVKMVKIQSDPKVYAVGHGGVLHWISTGAAATALYGANWAKNIDDIADAFFVNYTVGSQITAATDFVVATEQANSTSINADKGLSGGGALNITLASDNSLPATVTDNAQGINLLKINISGAGTITGLTFTRLGAGIAADWANVYLYDGDSRLTTGRSVSSTTNQVVFNNLNVVVSGSKTLTLIGDLVNPARVGDAHYFSLAAATDVVASTTVGGNFPVYGSLFSVSGSAGGSITADAGSFPSSPSMGQTGTTLANFKLSAGGTEDVSLRRLVITNSGAGQLSNLANLAITSGGVTVASNPIVSGSTATFVFAVPYVLAKGVTRTFSVIGDISAGNRAGVDTFKLYIDQSYDIYATGNTYGAGVNVTDNFDSARAGDPNSNPVGAALAIIGGQITFASNGPTTGDVSVGANDAVLFKFAITSVSHVEVHDLRMQINAKPALAVTGVLATDDVMSITDCKVINSDTGAALTNSYDLTAWTDNGAHTAFTKIFTDRFEIAAGTTMNMALTCDISSASPAAGKSLTGQINARVGGDIRNLDSSLDVALGDIVPASALTGNPQTVRVSGLTVGVASSPASATVTKGSTVNALGINLTAGSASDVKLTQMKLRGFISLDDSTTYGNTVNSHTMVNGTVGAAAYTAGVQMVTGVVAGAVSLAVGDHIAQAGVSPAAGIITVIGPGALGAGTITINTVTGVWQIGTVITNTTHVTAVFTPTSVTTSVDAPVAHTVQDVITSATVWDGTTQVGVAESPDVANGDMNFSNLSLNIAAGTTKTLTVKIILSNNLPYGVGTNRLFIDMIGDNLTTATQNVSAQDNSTNSVTATSPNWGAGDPNLQIVTTPSLTTPISAAGVGTVVVTAVRSGTLTAQIDGDTPVSAIITGSTSDNAVTRVKFSSLNEDFNVTRLTVENTNHASSRSITSVRLFDKDGTLFCSGTLDSNDRLRCANDAGLFTVSGNQVVTIKLNIDQVGSATSGGVPVMALYVLKGGGLADDVKAIGVSSGTALLDADVLDQGNAGFANASFKVFADAGGVDPDLISGNVFVLRKTQPTVTTVAVSTTLTPTPTVYKFSVTAASNADVTIKRFDLAESNVGQPTGAYILYENDTVVPAGQYRVCADTAEVAGVLTCTTDLSSAGGGIIVAGAAKVVSVIFNTEKVVSAGTTKTYRLDCSAPGAGANQSVTFKLLDDSAAGIVTGTMDAVNVVTDTLPGVLTGNHFIWSDSSADTHSSALVGAGGSADWTNGDLVKTLPTISQSLSL